MKFFSLLILVALVATAFLIGWFMASQIIKKKKEKKKKEEEKSSGEKRE